MPSKTVSKPAARTTAKAETVKVRTLPAKIPVTIDGVKVVLRAAKGKRTLSADKLRATMKRARAMKKAAS